LVAHALAGAQPAFQELVRRYQGPVVNLIARIVRDPALAEDLAQETFLKAFRSLPTFDPARKFSSWLFRIAHNASLDALRRRRARASRATEVGDPAIPPPPDPVETAALGRALDAALARLRPEQRTAVVLRYEEGCSYDEIAQAMGIPEGTAKTHVHRARKQLAEALAAAGWRPPREA
jgi:RNA polymerase sigma-70 factor (ECF subfamily)